MRARALESDCHGLSHNIRNPVQNFLGLNIFTCKVGMRKLMSQSCKNILIKNILFPFKMHSVAHFQFDNLGMRKLLPHVNIWCGLFFSSFFSNITECYYTVLFSIHKKWAWCQWLSILGWISKTYANILFWFQPGISDTHLSNVWLTLRINSMVMEIIKVNLSTW